MVSSRLEQTILKSLIKSDEYCRKALPFIEPEYFEDGTERAIYQEVKDYVEQYNGVPTGEALLIQLNNRKNITEDMFSEAGEIVSSFDNELPDMDWLVNSTEKWCQERAVYNAIMSSIQIMEGRDQKQDKGAIPKLLSDALGVSFDQHIGHDYLENTEERFDFYHRVEEKIPFDLEYFNKITKGGLPRKSLNIALAGTGVGKSLFMCHCASANLTQGQNVLYITLEMSEEKIAERIDANLLDVPIQQLPELDKKLFDKKIDRVKNKFKGKLIVKEYPTASVHAGHFRHLLNELNLKKNFKPDIIYIDYLNICASSRVKNTQANSYTIVKSIAEEIRGLAVEFNVPIVSATQTTRSGYSNTDVGLEDTSESFGLPATADLMFALISTEEMEELNQIMVKQLKNRYNDPGSNRRFVVGIDRSKMRLYDCEQDAQQDIVDSGQNEDDTPAFDKGRFGRQVKSEKFDAWSV
jgi:archaellum biogenesis ATPase FlaH